MLCIKISIHRLQPRFVKSHRNMPADSMYQRAPWGQRWRRPAISPTLEVSVALADWRMHSIFWVGAQAHSSAKTPLITLNHSGPLFMSDQIVDVGQVVGVRGDRKSTRLNSSHVRISYAVFCLKK